MKANELMIKDWVRYNDEPCRVWMVDWQYNLVRCHHNGREWTCGTEEITPIKLTTNILLDSGFESVSESLVSMKCFASNDKEDIYICIDFYDNGRIYLEINSKRKIIIISRIDFVHELQHILRSCGLNEIDDNIKV